YIRLFRKWLWLIIPAAFVAGGVSFIVNTGQTPLYTASVLLEVGSITDIRDPAGGQIDVAGSLADLYAVLATTGPVLEGTIEVLDANFGTERLRSAISTRVIDGTPLLRLTVRFEDPILAADIANELANQLIARGPGLEAEQQELLDFIQDERAQLEAIIDDVQLRMDQIDVEIAAANDPEVLDQLEVERNQIINQLNDARQTLASFAQTLNDILQGINTLSIVEPATVPDGPSGGGGGTLNAVILGALVGATLAMGVVFFIEYMDDTIRTTEQAAQILALPVLGAIVRFGGSADGYANRLVTQQPSMSPVAEGYRTLRTNLLFTASNGNGNKSVYLVASSGPAEGKSITTANLAATIALAGLQVLLIDADLRRPKIHEIFGLENNVGLTTLLFAEPEQGDVEKMEQGGEAELPNNLKQCLQNTSVPRLRVITSGFVPSNPAEILGSALMERWIDAFRRSSNIDVVLIDTPPCLLVADSSVLAATARADVLLVIDCGRTRRVAAIKAKEQFAHLGVEIKGVVVNRINPREESYEYGYGYGYYYTPDPQTVQQNGGLRRLVGRIFNREPRT
ncbi:MAG: polysaccharide biosynthesis tyrosine autokinase, partial [Chloroflexi bacterium]|nr:polysaccharide biosynthesis tyrosine autokinase [Chloroflexota bacterium]